MTATPFFHAAIFDKTSGDVRRILTSSPAQLNANLVSGQTWRAIPSDVVFAEDVPALSTLTADASLVEPA